MVKDCNLVHCDTALGVPRPIHNICLHVSDENIQQWQLLPKMRPLLNFKVSQLNGNLLDCQLYGNVSEDCTFICWISSERYALVHY